VVLDFGKPVLLTDVVVPMCGDLASLSIDIWVESEEIDGHRLVVSTDIGISSLVMNDIMPAPVCRYLKVRTEQLLSKSKVFVNVRPCNAFS
jgi:baculoviral IAP repeat-containing protein 6 (apollon)